MGCIGEDAVQCRSVEKWGCSEMGQVSVSKCSASNTETHYTQTIIFK